MTDDITMHLFAGGGQRESRIHIETKLMLARMAKSGSLILTTEVGGRFVSYHFETIAMKPVVECAYPSGEAVLDSSVYYARHGYYPEMIFDVGLTLDGEVVAALEVVRNHGLDDRKRRKIAASGILCICVKANYHEWYTDDRHIEGFEVIASPESFRRLEPILIGVP